MTVIFYDLFKEKEGRGDVWKFSDRDTSRESESFIGTCKIITYECATNTAWHLLGPSYRSGIFPNPFNPHINPTVKRW